MTEAKQHRLRDLAVKAYWAANTPNEARFVTILMLLLGMPDPGRGY